MTIQYRDLQLRQEERFSEKEDKRESVKAVIVDENGLSTGSGNIWADRNARRVWIMEALSAAPSQVPCYNITPVIGLGVIVGYELGSSIREVLRSDKGFLGPTNPNGTSYESPSNLDFRPGGRLQLWLASKLIEPLAVYPTTGLNVSVVSGDYPYGGTRKTFAGEENFLLTAPPTAGHHRYSGLYLDSSNTLQVVYGTSVAVAFDPIEPAWPAGAFRLAVVRIANGQTSITLSTDDDTDNDIIDRRMLFSDETSSTGWPFAHVITVSTTNIAADYATLATAIAGASAGDIILIDPNDTHALSGAVGLTVDKALTITCIGPRRATITNATDGSTTISVTAAGAHFVNLNITNTGAGGTESTCAYWAVDSVIWENCTFTKTGAASNASCLLPFGGTGWLIKDCELTVSGATNNYAIQNTIATTSGEVRGGKINGSTFDIFGDQTASVITLNNVILANGSVSFAGTLNWMPEAKIDKNLLADTLTFNNSWLAESTYNDIADDTYCGGLWNLLHNGQAPDITRQAGGSTDPFEFYLRCTFDSAASQAGIVQFLLSRDTIPLRGQTVSLSFDAWGTAVAELRAAVISWGSTADALTSDVVGTWATNNPTLATNWSYANTPAADIVITSTRTRYTVNNIVIPTTANNIAVFIWTSAEEASTDLFNIARVQLERGPVATEFVTMPYLEELRRINTFLYALGKITSSRTLGGRADAATTAFFGFQLPTEMRGVPSITLVNGAGNVRANDGAVNVNVTAISTNFSTRANIAVNLTTDTGLTTTRAIFIDFTSTSSYLLFDARL